MRAVYLGLQIKRQSNISKQKILKLPTSYIRAISHQKTRTRALTWSALPWHFPRFRWKTFQWETRFHFPTLSGLIPCPYYFLLCCRYLLQLASSLTTPYTKFRATNRTCIYALARGDSVAKGRRLHPGQLRRCSGPSRARVGLWTARTRPAGRVLYIKIKDYLAKFHCLAQAKQEPTALEQQSLKGPMVYWQHAELANSVAQVRFLVGLLICLSANALAAFDEKQILFFGRVFLGGRGIKPDPKPLREIISRTKDFK